MDRAGGDTDRRGITGSTLKLAAIISMFIDHAAAVLLEPLLRQRGIPLSIEDIGFISGGEADKVKLYITYILCRNIGRLAFPIFCFLLVEGFLHTRNAGKYFFRLLIFAFISEVPFDMALFNSIMYNGYQNVFFTLAIGLLALIFIRKLGQEPGVLFITAAAAMFAEFLNTDYSAFGVILIVVIYVLRYDAPRQRMAICVMTLWEITAPLSVLLIRKYNKERGMRLKYVFYAFYPLHLLVLYAIRSKTGFL